MKAITLLFMLACLVYADHHVKQRDVLSLLAKLNSESPDEKVSQTASGYNPEDHPANYEDFKQVTHFLKEYHKGKLRHKDYFFNLFDDHHRHEAITLFEIFMGCKTYDAFYKTAAWARQHINQGVFVYSFTVALLNREDTRGLHIPPMYEINPHYFTTTKVIQEAYSAKMKQTPKVIDMDFTGTEKNPEQWVAYFGEDIGLNNHHFHWHADFPFWWKHHYRGHKDRKGELFFYAHHMLTARFDHERLSVNLPEVEPLHWEYEIKEGFNPHTMYRKEGEFPFRTDHMHFHDLKHIKVHDLEHYEDRLRSAIKLGYLIDESGNPVDINNTRGIDLLGDAIESFDSVNIPYYGHLHNHAHIMLSRISDPLGKYGLPPGVMEHFETATRDPAFFRLHKYIDSLFKDHKNQLTPYTRDELHFPGVEIQSVVVTGGSDKDNILKTFFENFEFDISNALDDSEKVPYVPVHARVKRLNHYPFSYNIRVHSESDKTATVRIFLAPKYNYYGLLHKYNEMRWMMVELDRFPAKIHKGYSSIIRKSIQSSATIHDTLSFAEIKHHCDTNTLHLDKTHRHCGHPHRMLLPRGHNMGMEFELFVMLTDFDQDKTYDIDPEHIPENSLSYCGTINEQYPDKKPMGFPFDRRIDDKHHFYTPNMYFQDIIIKHVEDRHDHHISH